jgi:Zn-dependent peptidase ImmA (M78 family)/DNA-binding XRE family transcriptional regulator
MIARQKRRFTKIRLAEAAGLTSRSITAYECGEMAPTGERLTALANALKFPVTFFFAPEIKFPEVDAVSFRALSSMTAAQRDSARAAGALAIELSKWIEKDFTLPDSNLLDLPEYSPEAAASKVRMYWGLGERPIKNAVHLLEANGVRVFSLIEECREVDAFSVWEVTTPYIFLNIMKSGERGRFDAMHELGHLILHRHGGPDGRKAEQEADAFASAMLMPRSDVLAYAPTMPTLPTLINTKKRWNVSLSALVHRLHSINLISEWHYRTLCIQIAEKGYRLNEPDSVPRETSQLLQKVFSSLKEDGISRADVASELFLRGEDLDSLIFGLVPVGIDGGGSGGSTLRQRDHLRVVVNNE